MWIDSMRIQMRRDVPVAALIFEARYLDDPKQIMQFEVARLYTTMAHVKQIAEVLTKNVAAYEEQMGPLGTKAPQAQGEP